MTPAFTSDLFMTVLAGAAVLVTSMALGLWQILSAPDRPNYPTSGRVKRLLMFWVSAGLAYRGVEIIYLATRPDPVFSTPGQVITACLMSALFVTFLVDHLQHWLPARTHRNIRRIMAIAACRPSKGLIAARTSAMKQSTGEPCPDANVARVALVELAMQGAQVAGPNAGPEVFTEH